MSSADPTTHDIVPPPATATVRRSPKVTGRPLAAPASVAPDANARSETPQPKPENLRTDRPEPPEADQGREQGPTGIRGAFQTHPVAMIVCLGLILVGIIAGVAWYLNGRHYESTDDAFIDGRPVLVSPQVTGSIVRVSVTDNQIVKTGDLLAKIDPRDYQAALDQAAAQMRQAEATMRNLDAQA